ncbi:hypothetical protein [Streptomyces sp. TLI_105]|uniref:hypothetical protein n=1 Tax=Streptomyces sp. TLI_105 TaxID=1881019 RepID=UPI00089B8D7A|nr:hypothetical protein [Streptomyces sp. TLI_105]SEC06362.1 hypothetical protein SAMN05428939_1464 [Streptomyces sp. TLI_105]
MVRVPVPGQTVLKESVELPERRLRTTRLGLERDEVVAGDRDDGMGRAQRLPLVLGQVAAYLEDERVREGAIEAVLSQVTPDTKAVLAHSLGTVVAYEALHRLDGPLPLLVTFGSPLGLRSILKGRLRPLPMRSPAHLKRWVNVADGDDFIVATLRLRRLLPEDDAVLERTRRVRNRNFDPHGATEYLSRWETVEPLADLL